MPVTIEQFLDQCESVLPSVVAWWMAHRELAESAMGLVLERGADPQVFAGTEDDFILHSTLAEQAALLAMTGGEVIALMGNDFCTHCAMSECESDRNAEWRRLEALNTLHYQEAKPRDPDQS